MIDLTGIRSLNLPVQSKKGIFRPGDCRMALACLEAVKPCFNAVVKLRPTPRSPRRGERMRLQFAARSAAAHGVDCTWLLLRRRVRPIDGLATDNHDPADEQRKEEVGTVSGKRHPPLSRHHAVALGVHGASLTSSHAPAYSPSFSDLRLVQAIRRTTEALARMRLKICREGMRAWRRKSAPGRA